MTNRYSVDNVSVHMVQSVYQCSLGIVTIFTLYLIQEHNDYSYKYIEQCHAFYMKTNNLVRTWRVHGSRTFQSITTDQRHTCITTLRDIASAVEAGNSLHY